MFISSWNELRSRDFETQRCLKNRQYQRALEKNSPALGIIPLVDSIHHMKKLLILTCLFISSYTFADFDKGVREATLRANKSFDMGTLDQVGSTIKNKKSGEILRNHCLKRLKDGECKEIIHTLSFDNKDLVLHDRRGQVINQNASFIKYRLEMTFKRSLENFTDFDPNYRRSPGDFTGYLGMNCIYEKETCKLLVLLPLSIAADLILLPLDLSIMHGQRLVTRKQAKIFIENLESDQEMIELSNREFTSMLRGLSQF